MAQNLLGPAGSQTRPSETASTSLPPVIPGVTGGGLSVGSRSAFTDRVVRSLVASGQRLNGATDGGELQRFLNTLRAQNALLAAATSAQLVVSRNVKDWKRYRCALKAAVEETEATRGKLGMLATAAGPCWRQVRVEGR